MTPSNTAIVKGYNALTGSNVRLGRWDEYLALREGVLRLNTEHRDLFSNDLGAIAGLLFDVGSGRYPVPPHGGDSAARAAWEKDLAEVRESAARRQAAQVGGEGDRTHTEIQAWLRDLGLALGFAVHMAANGRGRNWGNGRLGDGCLDLLPSGIAGADGAEAIRLIDVLWLDANGRVAAAFEVEHSTTIYSGNRPTPRPRTRCSQPSDTQPLLGGPR